MCVPQVIRAPRDHTSEFKPKSPSTWLPCRVFMIGHALTIAPALRFAADEVGEEMIDVAAFDDAHAAPLSGRDRLDFAAALKAIDEERGEPGDDE